MGTSTGHVMTIANSIIGVSVLAMPFCFKQCGIVLSILLLLLSGIMTRLACHYLLKSAITARRRNFEFLAFHAFGPTGKLFVELGVIGFMLGTCIAFFVVMGDLGPVIIGPALNIDSFSTLRPSVLMGLGLLVVLPLGLLRNVDSLSAICAASVAFYLCLVLKVMGEAATHLISWDWVDKVNLWRPAGIPQCIPIFSMALSCQTQIFEIFDSVPNTSLEKMNAVIKSAINMCTAVYISVGFFGYVAFCTQNFSGNLLMSFSPTILSEIIKLGFVLSVAVSFPLVIFPCRASLHSLLFRRGHTPHYELLSAGGNYIPEPRFKCLTIFIVMFSLGTGLLIPSIEVVLGLVGSTIGIMICIIFPALTFICISNKNNNERLVAQGLFALGLIIMVLGTYTNLYATEEALTKPDIEVQKIIPPPLKMPSNIVQIPLDPPDLKDKQKSFSDKVDGIVKEMATQAPIEIKKEIVIENIPEEVNSNKRKEPPVPVAPGDNIVKENILPPVPSDLSDDKKENKVDKVEEKLSDNAEKVQVQSKNEEIISNDAINREEEEIKEAGDRNLEIQKKNEDLLDKLKKHEAEQKKLIEEQKALLEELKKQNQQQKEKIDISAENKLKDTKTEDKRARELLKKPIVNVPKDTSKIDVPEELPKVPIVKTVDKPVAVDNKILVKSDVNSNISVNRSVNNTPPILKDKNLSPSLTSKMVKGVPLPIAVKDNIIVDKKPDNKLKDTDNKLEDADNKMRNIDNQLKNIETKKVDEVQENKPMVRDILNDKINADVKEEREKRDLDFVEKSENLIQTNVNKVVKNQPDPNKDKQEIQEVVLPKDNSDGSNENCEKDDKEIKTEQTKEPIVDSYIKTNLNFNKNNSNNDNNKPIEPKQELQAVQKELGNKEEKFKVVTEHSLIKTPSYLSQPELPALNAVNIKNADNNIMGGIKEIKPQLRDLKSIGTQDEKLDRRQERASEIT